MAMRQCDKCSENQWSFNADQKPVLVATCLHCGHEVSWVSDKLLRKSRRPQKPSDVPLDNYKQQDPGDDGIAPWV